MRKTTIILNLLIFTTLISCNFLPFKKIKCRDYEMSGENFWFPNNVGDTIKFKNSENELKEFIVRDKYIRHRTKYISDTGCNCNDLSGMLLTNQTDSIWFNNNLVYIYDNEGEYYEELCISIDSVQSVFFETSKSIIKEHKIDTLIFRNVEKFELERKDNKRITKVIRAKNIGIIQFDLKNGEVWTKLDLTDKIKNDISSFECSEHICN